MIHIFVRHCNYSNASAHKTRPLWFSREKFFKILLNEKGVNLTVIFDGDSTDHFVSKTGANIKLIEAGTEAMSFTKMLDYVMSLEIPDDDIIYFVEDDYLHIPGFSKILEEGFSTNVDYVTLYDHGDKYMPGYYEMYARGFQIQIVPTKSIHWRTTPSTTNTYAMKMSTLKRDLQFHYKYSKDCQITHDHEKFCALWNSGKSLISCIPAYSTHCDFAGIAPIIDWNKMVE